MVLGQKMHWVFNERATEMEKDFAEQTLCQGYYTSDSLLTMIEAGEHLTEICHRVYLHVISSQEFGAISLYVSHSAACTFSPSGWNLGHALYPIHCHL